MAYAAWKNVQTVKGDLVGGFNPWKISQIRSLPQVGVKMKKNEKHIWNHHLVIVRWNYPEPFADADGHLFFECEGKKPGHVGLTLWQNQTGLRFGGGDVPWDGW